MRRSTVPIEVRRSKIHGRGVFVLAPVEAGMPIVEYTGERISREEALRRHGRRSDAPTYLLELDDRTLIDGASNGSEARFVNHSCAPNCELVTYRKRVFVFARRDVRAGEELTLDYGLVVDGASDLEEALRDTRCRCGSSRCRGSMLNRRRRPRRASR